MKLKSLLLNTVKSLVGISSILLIVACGSGQTQEPPELTPPSELPVDPPPSTGPIDIPDEPIVREYSVSSTWYEIPQYYDGVPKYGGFLGTYTAKHIPVAVSCNVGDWAVYSNVENGVTVNYSLNLTTGDSFLIREMNINDPHQNGAIQCIDDTLYVAISARNTTQSGFVYTSKDGMNWSLVGENMEAYPQLHVVNGELITLYTLYLNNPSNYGTSRYIFSSCNDEPIVDISSEGHYMVSYYDGQRIHVVYNDHPNGSVDNRRNLNYKYSTNGCEWSEEETWYSGDKLVYLKDLNKVNGKLTALVTLSTSFAPTKGKRSVYTITSDRIKEQFETNHNYTTGSILRNGEIVFPKGSTRPYAGGQFAEAEPVNYIRRVHGKKGHLIGSEGISVEYDSDAWIISIQIDF